MPDLLSGGALGRNPGAHARGRDGRAQKAGPAAARGGPAPVRRGARTILRDAASPCPSGARPAGGAARHHGRAQGTARRCAREGNPDGFLKSTGLSRCDDCEQRETPKGPVWFAVKQEKGRPTTDLLADYACQRRWLRSPGPSPCAGMSQACAGSARSAPSSACWTMQSFPSASARVDSGQHHARPPLPLVRPAHGGRCW